MPALGLPLLIALLPLAAMAILQFLMPVVAPLVMTDIGRPAEAYGWLGGAMGLGSVLLLATNHLVMPVLGPVRTLQAGLLIAIAGIACVLTGIWPIMLAGALLTGYGYATTTPAGSQVLADFTPRALWGTLFSMRMAAVPLGGMIAGALGGLVAPVHGWRTAFLVVAISCFIVFVLLAVLPRHFNESRPLQAFTLDRVQPSSMLSRPMRVVTSIPGLPSLAFGSWCLACVHAVVTTFYVIYLVATRGMPLTTAAALFAVLQVAAITGRILIGALADRIGSTLPVLKLIAPLAGAAAILLSIMAADWSMPTLIAATIYIGATVGTFNGLYLAEVARLAPSGEVGDATASVAVFMFTAYLLAPPIAGLAFTTFGAAATLRTAAVMSLVGLAVLIGRDRL
jgi:MFS family permease